MGPMRPEHRTKSGKEFSGIAELHKPKTTSLNSDSVHFYSESQEALRSFESLQLWEFATPGMLLVTKILLGLEP